MDLFPIVRWVSNGVMIVSFIITFVIMCCGIIYCLCMEDNEYYDHTSMETVSFYEENELDSYERKDNIGVNKKQCLPHEGSGRDLAISIEAIDRFSALFNEELNPKSVRSGKNKVPHMAPVHLLTGEKRIKSLGNGVNLSKAAAVLSPVKIY